MLKKIEEFCQKWDLFRPGDPLVVACSGGPDSLALLDVLSRLAPSYDLHITACYVHHGIRAAADQEVEVVRQAAESRHCQFTWARSDVPALAKARHESLETTGRLERYRLLREAAASCGAAAIAVAHHQNDQAETVLQHLLRGSGIHGLAGMAPKNGDIIRPFLAVTRRDIEEYVKEQGLVPCEDETNRSTEYTRNRIRWDLLPELAHFNPAVVADLNRLAHISRADDDFLEAAARERYDQYVKALDGGCEISKHDLLQQPLAMRRRLVRLMFQSVSGEERGVPFHYAEVLCGLAEKGAGHAFETRHVTVYTTYDMLRFVRQEQERRKKSPSHQSDAVPVTGAGTYCLGPYTLEACSLNERPAAPGKACLLDGAAFAEPLELRFRRSGDWIRRGRLGQRRSIKRFFIDCKIPAPCRDTIPMLCRGEEVLWVCGYAVGTAAAVTVETKLYMLCNITGGDFHA